MEKIKIIAVVGPTASGKTKLAIELAKRFDGEIISADSMQIYKGMDIATAKPTAEEQREAKHHLVGFLEPSDTFSVAKFVSLAEEKIVELSKKNKTPVICGGTGLYIDSLLKSTEFLDGTYDEKIRNELENRIEVESTESLYNELEKIDSEAAKKIHPNNKLKIVRALEIFYASGKTLTEQNKLSHEGEEKFDSLIIGLKSADRQYLYDRINLRVDLMLEAGLEDEAKDFFLSEKGNTACQAIGYKELKPYLDGEISRDEAIENLKRASRRYAKRQLTWFGRNDKIKWLNIDELKNNDELYLQAEVLVKDFLKGR